MGRTYSISEAREHLSEVVEEAARGQNVELTRDGETVAVVVSVEEYRLMKTPEPSETFAEGYKRFREMYPEGTDGIGPEFFNSLRDRGPGRGVDLAG